ncbi:MAG TPA: type II toxin-antitoxin system RelE/ParE family toxin, partial [Thermoanaerobaculia bacterium]|nr:type II toxin-antitoxin system RelE/ParE family toxin [Thermoanaerobaculia bacterium]
LDPQVRRRIEAALVRFATTGHGDIARLTGVEPPQYRLRVGDWRVVFAVDRPAGSLYVAHVAHRSVAYR